MAKQRTIVVSGSLRVRTSMIRVNELLSLPKIFEHMISLLCLSLSLNKSFLLPVDVSAG